MPSLIFNSKVAAVSGHCKLILQIKHRLDRGPPSDAPHCRDWAALFASIDVLPASDLVITLAGSHNAAETSPEDVARSCLAKHLAQFFHKNATQLGLDHVSGVIYDQGDVKPKVIVRASCLPALQLQRMSTCATLTRLDLVYNWETPSQQSCSETSVPFSRFLALPYLALLDDVLKRFVKKHLVKRYPLIFGFWRRQLRTESVFYPSIYRSIHSIVNRSSDPEFKRKCENLFMTLRNNMLAKTTEAAASLSNTLADHLDCVDAPMSDVDTLCLAMERLFQAGMPLPKFQAIRQRPMSDRTGDDQLSQSLPPCPPDEDSIDSTHNSSTFAHFPLVLHDQYHQRHPQAHQNGDDLELFPPRVGNQGPHVFDLLDDISSGQLSQPYISFLASGSLASKSIDVIYSVSSEGSSQETENSGSSSAASHAPDHMMLLPDFCEDSPLVDNGDVLIFTSDDETCESRLSIGSQCGAVDRDYEIATYDEDFSPLAYDSLDDQDFFRDDDDSFLPHAILETAARIASGVDLNGGKKGDVAQYVPSSILSEAHPPHHAPCTPAACFRADQKERHDEIPFTQGQTSCDSAIWDQIIDSTPVMDEFIMLAADGEGDEYISGVMDWHRGLGT